MKRSTRNDPRNILARSDALKMLPDEEIVTGLERLHGEGRAVLLEILLYLIEADRRRFFLSMGYGSLFEFCTGRLKCSRSAAWRRISAARCLRNSPQVGELLLSGELTLTVVSMISGILTKENAGELLPWIRGKSSRDVGMLVSRHRPVGILRDRVKPVCIMTAISDARGTAWVNAGNDAGCDAGNTSGTEAASTAGCEAASTAGFVNAARGGCNANSSSGAGTKCKASLTFTPATGSGAFEGGAPAANSRSSAGSETFPGTREGVDRPAGDENAERVMITQKFRIEFAVDPEFIQKLERARSLLSTRHPGGMTFERLFTILLDEYLERHGPDGRNKKRERRKSRGAKGNPEKSRRAQAPDEANGGHGGTTRGKDRAKQTPRSAARSRHIPASVRDEAFVRDGGRCTFVGDDGARCDSPWNPEIDHIVPHAKGGSNAPDNLRLLRAGHNRLVAEREYGKERMERYHRRE